MELTNSFEVAVPAERVWRFLLDVERVVPCVPGAAVTEIVDDSQFKGALTVKVGPVRLSYNGTVTMAERNDELHRVVLSATATETRGKGVARAKITSQLTPVNGTTRVDIVTDLAVSGAMAHFRQEMLGDVSRRFTAEFAQTMAAMLATGPNDPPSAELLGGTKAIGGFRLAVWALYRSLVRSLRRLFAS